MKYLFKFVLTIICVVALVTGVQAQEQDPVGLTPTEEDAEGMRNRSNG